MICVPIVSVGFSEVIGSWKIIAISRPRTSSSCRSESFVRSRPSKMTEPGDDLRGRLRDQAHDRERGHRLAAAGLADDPERLALLDREADAVDGAHDALAGEEVGAEVVDFEQGHGYVSFVRGSSASRRPSAMKLAQTTSVAIATDGTMIAIGWLR